MGARRFVIVLGLRGMAFVLALVLAGCFSSPASPNDSDASPALPPSLDVDLRDYALSITMPEGQSAMLVALKITQDMWIRPVSCDVPFYVGSPADGCLVDGPQADYWMLCPVVITRGLPAGAHYVVIPFWLGPEGELTLAVQHLRPVERTDESLGCIEGEVGLRVNRVARPFPQDGVLTILFGAVGMGHGSFDVQIGIGMSSCPADSTIPCLPQALRDAEPWIRGLTPAHAERGYGEECIECGFEINDGRTPAGAAGVTGTVVIKRAATSPGILWIDIANVPYVGAGYAVAGSSSEMTVRLAQNDTMIEATCFSRITQGVIGLLAQFQGIGTMEANLAVSGPRDFRARMYDFAVPLSNVGLDLAPAVVANVADGIGSPADGSCR